MKSPNTLFSKATLTVCLLLLPFVSIAMDEPKIKKSENWQKELDERVVYNQQNKQILKGNMVLLEVIINEDGTVTVVNCNSTNSKAAEYVKQRINGVHLNSLPEDQKFILKYIYK